MVMVDEIQTIWPKSSFVKKFGNQWCHMTADNLDELHALADKIGLQRRWFQAKSNVPHYDLTPTYRAKAIEAGAVEKSAREQAKERIAARNAKGL